MRGSLLATGQRLEDFDIRDFIDVVYAYAINGGPERNAVRDNFIEYAWDLKAPAEKMASQPFDVQSKSMLDELDAFRGEFPAE